MRRSLVAGVVLAVAATIVVLVSHQFDLNLESVTLLGAAMGAVVALVPDGTPGSRLGGFAAGFLIGWVGYIFRAQFMPDTASGRAVTVGVVVFLCVAVTAVAMGRLPLWSILLGAGAFSGAYEFTYNEAPPEVLSTSLSTATALALTVAVGFVVLAFFAPSRGAEGGEKPAPPPPDTTEPTADERTSLEEFMKEPAK